MVWGSACTHGKGFSHMLHLHLIHAGIERCPENVANHWKLFISTPSKFHRKHIKLLGYIRNPNFKCRPFSWHKWVVRKEVSLLWFAPDFCVFSFSAQPRHLFHSVRFRKKKNSNNELVSKMKIYSTNTGTPHNTMLAKWRLRDMLPNHRKRNDLLTNNSFQGAAMTLHPIFPRQAVLFHHTVYCGKVTWVYGIHTCFRYSQFFHVKLYFSTMQCMVGEKHECMEYTHVSGTVLTSLVPPVNKR